jgi:hypothetical protein
MESSLVKRQVKATANPKKVSTPKRKAASTPWPTVEEFLHHGGNIQLGALGPHGPTSYAAVASGTK